jgi:DNA-directed RNA polymerase subunit RPC12/RpoP
MVSGMDLYSCKTCGRRYLSLSAERVGRCPDCGERLTKIWMPEVPRAEAGSFSGGDQTYASMEDFVRADLARLSSREIDFGVLWRDGANSSYRAAWVEQTGELYVVQAGPPSAGGGHVEVLGVTDRPGVEAALEGWQARAREHASIGWIRRRAAQLPRVSSRPRRRPAVARAGGSGGSGRRSSLSGGWRPSRAGG